MNFATKLKYYRQKNHITQKELANKISKSVRSISYYENLKDNKNLPKPEILERIAEVFNVSVSELLGAEEKETPEELLINLLEERTKEGLIQWNPKEILMRRIDGNCDDRIEEMKETLMDLERLMLEYFLKPDDYNDKDIYFSHYNDVQYLLLKPENDIKNSYYLIANLYREERTIAIYSDNFQVNLRNLFNVLIEQCGLSYQSILSDLISNLK